MINEIIIVGGGPSITPQIDRLRPVLASKCTILTNYAYKTFPGTFLTFTDRNFYKSQDLNDNPDIYEDLKTLPLIIGIKEAGMDKYKLDNTILLDKSEKETLTGIFALKLAEKLIKIGTIFLLGFDWTRRSGLPERDPNYNPMSNLPVHYYNNINHRGIGYVGYYENHNADIDFAKLIKRDVKIYNVSPESNINCFEKIDYDKMFSILSADQINQFELRNQIKEKLCIV